MELIASDSRHSGKEEPLTAALDTRVFRKVRLSVTDACNYACDYCDFSDTRRKKQNDHLDTVLGSAMLASLSRAGCTHIKFTGGEPLLAPNLAELIDRARQLGYRDISLTTNGELLASQAERLSAAGLQRVTVSLDTLKEERARIIHRGGSVRRVMDGIEVARNAGLEVKTNTVVLRSANFDELPSLVAFGVDFVSEIRFIELMNTGHWQSQEQKSYQEEFVSRAEILSVLNSAGYQLESQGRNTSDTAEKFSIDAHSAKLAIVANTSTPFCVDCDRLRVDRRGRIWGCLASSTSFEGKDHWYKDDGHGALDALLKKALKTKQRYSFPGRIHSLKHLGG